MWTHAVKIHKFGDVTVTETARDNALDPDFNRGRWSRLCHGFEPVQMDSESGAVVMGRNEQIAQG